MKKSNLVDYHNYRISKRGRITRISDGSIIKCYLNHKFNRYYCWLCNSNNKRVKVYRYRLVAMAWIPNPDNKPEVCHIDNNSVHDYYKNLYWGTHKENMEQMVRDGRTRKGMGKSTITLIKKKGYQRVSFEIPVEKLEVIIKNFFGKD